MKTEFWFLFERSEQLPDTWVAQCLDLDVVTYGRSVEHALEMVLEASRMILDEDAEAGLDPLARRAPKEDWDKLEKLRQAPKAYIPVGMMNTRQDDFRIFAVQTEIPKVAQVRRRPAVKRGRVAVDVAAAAVNNSSYGHSAIAL